LSSSSLSPVRRFFFVGLLLAAAAATFFLGELVLVLTHRFFLVLLRLTRVVPSFFVEEALPGPFFAPATDFLFVPLRGDVLRVIRVCVRERVVMTVVINVIVMMVASWYYIMNPSYGDVIKFDWSCGPWSRVGQSR
jgi:hypothetical protein